MKDSGIPYSIWKIKKWKSEEDYANNIPFEEIVFEKNLLLNEGINELFKVLCSNTGTRFDESHAYLGVGDGTDAVSASQTGLQGSNVYYKAMDSGFPTYGTSQKATWQSVFAGDEANFNWQEFTIANGNSNSAKNLNRKVSSQGIKYFGQVWQLSFEISLS